MVAYWASALGGINRRQALEASTTDGNTIAIALGIVVAALVLVGVIW